LEIVEAMAMGKAVVSTTLGAEAIEAVDGTALSSRLTAVAFVAGLSRLLAESSLAGAHRQCGAASGRRTICLA